MIGDAWQNDIVGARGAGIRAIWLNRYGIPCLDPLLAQEISAFEPLEIVLAPIHMILEDEMMCHLESSND